MYVILQKIVKGKKQQRVSYEPCDVVATYPEAKEYIASDPLNFVIEYTSKAILKHYS